jgi:hypothetical protein
MAEDYTVNKRARFSSSGFYPELWDACWTYQKGRCALCTVCLVRTKEEDSQRVACADHCHTDKLPRGIVCFICNMALGMYEKHQRPNGLLLGAYEHYLQAWPTRQFERPSRAQRQYKKRVAKANSPL